MACVAAEIQYNPKKYELKEAKILDEQDLISAHMHRDIHTYSAISQPSHSYSNGARPPL